MFRRRDHGVAITTGGAGLCYLVLENKDIPGCAQVGKVSQVNWCLVTVYLIAAHVKCVKLR